MRYPRGLQVLLLKPNSIETYPEVEQGTHKFAVGEPGQPFEVQVKVPQEVFLHNSMIRVDLCLDGLRPGVGYTLHQGDGQCIFKGYKTVVDGQHRYKQFVFSKPSSTVNHAVQAPRLATGRLSVTFTHVVELSRRIVANPTSATVSNATAQHVEDKKWFLQPSLSVRPGRLSDKSFNLYDVSELTIATLAECTLQMETAAVLTLRKVLQQSIPAHQTIMKAAGLLSDSGCKATTSSTDHPSCLKLGVKRKLPFGEISRQTVTVIGLCGPAQRTYTLTKQVNGVDLTQVSGATG